MEGDIIVGIDGTDVENQVSVVNSVVAYFLFKGLSCYKNRS
jgi:hypothetical protein